MEFIELLRNNEHGVKEMSVLATEIVGEYYDPIIGKEQNAYMLELFQSEKGIKNQLENGYRYFFVKESGGNLGFIAFRKRENALYLSKFYLYKSERGKGYGRRVLEFLVEEAKKENLPGIELNVNKNNKPRFIYEHLGFIMIRSEKNDIGHGFFMDDYVYRLDIR